MSPPEPKRAAKHRARRWVAGGVSAAPYVNILDTIVALTSLRAVPLNFRGLIDLLTQVWTSVHRSPSPVTATGREVGNGTKKAAREENAHTP